MWFSFWRPRDRFSLDELRYITDQLMKVQIVNEVNKSFVIEALRSIAELITYGDQNDVAFFDYFMEKQVMGELVRILKISRTTSVSLQLLQSMSIMIQNLKSEHAIYYMFSNEHINYLITYSFDFRNEELLSYYISFLRAISGKLNRNTISLFVKTQNEEVVDFPLYKEAIQFAFHEESMVRTAVRALTLNVYHVGDEAVNKYISCAPQANYFLNLMNFFREQSINLNALVSNASKNSATESISIVLSAVDEIEDNLYYFSDVISAGIPDMGRLITDSILKLLIFPLLLPSLRRGVVEGMKIGPVTAMYLLCCILRVVKIKDLSNTIAAALFCPLEAFTPNSESKLNGHMPGYGFSQENQNPDNDTLNTEIDRERLRVIIPNSSGSSEMHLKDEVLPHNSSGSQSALRETLISYVTTGDDVQVVGSLSILATLLQTKELEESMLDALGILPQRQQHKKLLLQALVGEASGEEQLFSSESSTLKDGFCGEPDIYLGKLKDHYGLSCSCPEVGPSPRAHRYQVLDALVSLFCRSNISADTLWDGGWLLRQLLPYSEAEFNSRHLKLLKDSYKKCTKSLIAEARGIWSDFLLSVLCDEWRKCKRAIEASSPRKEPKSLLFPSRQRSLEESIPGESSYGAAERMHELVKVFVLLHQLQIFSAGGALPDQPHVNPTIAPDQSRGKAAGIDALGPKPGAEVKLVDAVSCRISFERGKERHFRFLPVSAGSSGWVLLAEESPLKQNYGVVRVTAPLAGCNPRIDEKHSRWLHLRIRPSTFPFTDTPIYAAKGKPKPNAVVDGRWTLAFRDEESCKSAFSMTVEEMELQSNEVERILEPVVDLAVDFSKHSQTSSSQITASRRTLSN